MSDDIQFLKDLQKQIRWESENDYDSQAFPRFWAIMDYKWVVTAEGYEDRVMLFDTSISEYVNLEEYIEEVLSEEKRDEFPDYAIEDLEWKKEWGSLGDVVEWIQEYDDNSDIYAIFEEKVSFIVPSTMFLTKEEAKRHLKVNSHHYTSEAHTYAMTAWRAPKVERLIKILNEFDFDSLGS